MYIQIASSIDLITIHINKRACSYSSVSFVPVRRKLSSSHSVVAPLDLRPLIKPQEIPPRCERPSAVYKRIPILFRYAVIALNNSFQFNELHRTQVVPLSFLITPRIPTFGF